MADGTKTRRCWRNRAGTHLRHGHWRRAPASDCHSNETIWPWYSSIAPISWLVQRDVDQGRRAVNFSEWSRPQKEAREAAKTVREGEMPPWIYTIRRASARLSATEKEALARGLAVTLAPGGGAVGAREHKNER
jgi:hypothetical protein